MPTMNNNVHSNDDDHVERLFHRKEKKEEKKARANLVTSMRGKKKGRNEKEIET